jgi:hypothetical protein
MESLGSDTLDKLVKEVSEKIKNSVYVFPAILFEARKKSEKKEDIEAILITDLDKSLIDGNFAVHFAAMDILKGYGGLFKYIKNLFSAENFSIFRENVASFIKKTYSYSKSAAKYGIMEFIGQEKKIPNETFLVYKNRLINDVKKTAEISRLNPNILGYFNALREYNHISKDDSVHIAILTRTADIFVSEIKNENKELKNLKIIVDGEIANKATYNVETGVMDGGFDRIINTEKKFDILINLAQQTRKNIVYFTDGEIFALKNIAERRKIKLNEVGVYLVEIKKNGYHLFK